MQKQPSKSRSTTSFRLSSVAKQLLEKLAEQMGLSQTGVLETLIRDKAKQEGMKLPRK